MDLKQQYQTVADIITNRLLAKAKTKYPIPNWYKFIFNDVDHKAAYFIEEYEVLFSDCADQDDWIRIMENLVLVLQGECGILAVGDNQGRSTFSLILAGWPSTVQAIIQ